MGEKKCSDVFIQKRINDFCEKNENVINLLFRLLKKIKPKIVDSFVYSDEYPQFHPSCKYTDKLFIGCILYVLKYGTTWESFLGPIPGKQLHKRHLEYYDSGLYLQFFNTTLKKYLENNRIKYLSIDSTIINNKFCIELENHLPINKNRKGVKISVIVDDIGSPLTYIICESTVHDSKIAINNINDMLNNKIINNAFDKTNGYVYLLGDKGYDSFTIKNIINDNDMKHIISPNNRNTKDPNKKYLTEHETEKIKKRMKVENFFAIIKRTAKINCIYEKKLESYNGLLLLLLGSILLNRINDE
jgi:hypothetical protein